jgi:hypothetical protein
LGSNTLLNETYDQNVIERTSIKMGKLVHLLWFVQANANGEDTELLIGIYESKSDAESAIERLRAKPGFVDFPQGFQIHQREVGLDSWTEGFVRAAGPGC